VWDDVHDRHWLLLEFVEGAPVRDCEIEHWLAAAECLGKIHGFFYRDAAHLRECDFLLQHDAQALSSKPQEAADAIEATAPHLKSRFETIAHEYSRFVEVMVASPFTLVHGAYRPQNVMACEAAGQTRYCAYDWEEAAFGSPYYDLAYLVDGFDPPMLKQFFDRYVTGAEKYGMPTPSRARMQYEVDCFRLHMSVNSLSRATLKKYSEDIVSKLLRDAMERYEDVQRSAHA
jgi:aminoglycoside phosphotransferase (APT) family kinase protein